MNADLFVWKILRSVPNRLPGPNFEIVLLDTLTKMTLDSVSFDLNYENYSKFNECKSVCVWEINWSVSVCFSVCFNLNLFADHLLTQMSNVG